MRYKQFFPGNYAASILRLPPSYSRMVCSVLKPQAARRQAIKEADNVRRRRRERFAGAGTSRLCQEDVSIRRRVCRPSVYPTVLPGLRY